MSLDRINSNLNSEAISDNRLCVCNRRITRSLDRASRLRYFCDICGLLLPPLAESPSPAPIADTDSNFSEETIYSDPEDSLDLDEFAEMNDLAAAFNRLADQLKRTDKVIDIEPFNGHKNMSFDNFLNKYLAFCDLTGKDEHERLNHLPFLLKGRAFDFYINLPEETRENFDLTTQALKNHFSPPECQLTDSAKCFSLKMKPDESVNIFYEKLIKSANKLTLSDNNKMLIFVNGLKDNLREFVVLQSPNTLDEALKLAKTKESVSLNYGTENALQQILHKIENVSQLDTRSNKDREISNLKRELQQLRSRMNMQHSSPRTTNSDRHNSSPSNSNSAPICFYCKKIGHLASECRARTRNSFQNNPQFQNTNRTYRPPPQQNYHRNNQSYDPKPYPYDTFQSQNRAQTFNQNIQNNNPQQNRPAHTQQNNSQNKNNISTVQTCLTSNTFTSKPNMNCNVTSLTNQPMTINGFLGNMPISLLLDTGSACNCFNIDTYNKLQCKPDLKSSEFNSITTVDGSNTHLFGSITQPVTLNNTDIPISFQVMKLGNYDAILGRSFMKQYNALIDSFSQTVTFRVAENLLTLRFGDVQTQSEENPDLIVSECEVKVSEDTILEPRTEHFIQVFPAKNILSESVLIENLSNLSEKYNFVTAKSVCKGTSDTFPCRIVNVTSKPIYLQKNMTVGIATALTSDSMINTIDLETTSTKSFEKVDFNIDSSEISENQFAQFKQFLDENRDVFAANVSELGNSNIAEHTIRVTNETPIKSSPYRTSPLAKEEIERHINELLDNGIIQESNSAWSSPVILVKKPHGATRLCIDYRKLNSITEKTATPLPKINEIFDHLSNAKYFSSLDMFQGYYQLGVAEDSRKYTAFATHLGLFEFLKLPFGVCNGPSCFNSAMASALRGLQWKYVLTYIDDLLVYSSTFSEHIERLNLVFQRFREANLKLKPSKCFFLQKELTFLGHTISAKGIKPNDEKIKIVKAFQVPKTAKNIKQFLGLCSFYRRYVPNFAKISAPLNELLRKDKKFVWSDKCQTAFEQLKEALINPPILAFPDFSKPFLLYTDASGEAIGYVLGQIQNGEEKVIAYAGRTLEKPERNYGISELEALAVIEAVKYFRPYLYGRKFTIFTDHKNLQWIFKTSDLKGKMARYSVILQEFDFDIQYKPGKQLANADALSRLQENSVNATDINSDISLRQRRDPELIQLISYLENGQDYSMKVDPSISIEKCHEFFIRDNILYKTIKPNKPYDATEVLVIPDNLRKEILAECHDSPLAGHLGFQKTYEKIRQRYFWPKMYSQIHDYVHTCESCLKRKPATGQKSTPLNPIKFGMPFENISVDILGPMTTTDSGNKYILLFTDGLTHWPEAVCLPSTEAQRVAQSFYELIICRHGAPRTLLSDRGANFLSSLMQEVYQMMNVKKLNTTAYAPATNGRTERFNAYLATALTHYCDKHQKNWDKFVQSVLFAYRTSVCTTTGETPFFLLYGRRATLPLDVQLIQPTSLPSTYSDYKIHLVKNLALSQKIASEIAEKSQEKMKNNYDKNATETKFKIGDMVLLHDPTKKKGLTKKLSFQWEGPYQIIRQLSSVNFELDGLEKKSSIVHANRLKLYPGPTKHTLREIMPKIDEDISLEDEKQTISNENSDNVDSAQNKENAPSVTFKVQNILEHRRRGRHLEYLVHTENEPIASASWKKSKDVANQDLIIKYLKTRDTYPSTRSKTKANVACLNAFPDSFIPKREMFKKLFTILFMSIFSLSMVMSETPTLGPLINCDVSKILGIHSMPAPLHCMTNISNQNIETFQADIQKYEMKNTQVYLYQCTLKKLILKCSENFFLYKTKVPEIYYVTVNKTLCTEITKSKKSPFGDLTRVGLNVWKTTHDHKYTCSWLKTKSIAYYEFIVERRTASLTGTSTIIRQEITSTTCRYHKFFCIPKESPKSPIIWLKSDHSFRAYTHVGTYQAKKLDNFILIPHLGIGGSIILDYQTSFLLDIGYKVIQIGNYTSHSKDDFDEKSKQYVINTKSNVQRELGQGRFTANIIHEHEIVSHLAKSMCRNNADIRQLQRWILNAFPDMAGSYLFPEGNHLIEPVGSAFIIHECQKISKYNIFWNYSVSNTCYKEFPITSQELPKLYFLNVKENRLYSYSQKINCESRKYPLYISDKEGFVWKLSKDQTFKKLLFSQYITRFSPEILPKLSTFSKVLMHYDFKPPNRLSLLEILAKNRENLEILQDYKEQGDGDVISGIGKLLGTTLSSVATGSSKIISSLGKGIKDALSGVTDLDTEVVHSISNASAVVIKSTTSGLSKIIKSIGGISSILLWILVLGLYAMIIYKNWPANWTIKRKNRNRPQSLLIKEPSFRKKPIPPPRNASVKFGSTPLNPPPSPAVSFTMN